MDVNVGMKRVLITGGGCSEDCSRNLIKNAISVAPVSQRIIYSTYNFKLLGALQLRLSLPCNISCAADQGKLDTSTQTSSYFPHPDEARKHQPNPSKPTEFSRALSCLQKAANRFRKNRKYRCFHLADSTLQILLIS